MAQGTHDAFFFLFLPTIYKEKVREMNKKQVIRINENQIKQIVSECVNKMLKEDIDTHYEIWQKRKDEVKQTKELLQASIPKLLKALQLWCDFQFDEADLEKERGMEEIAERHINNTNDFYNKAYNQIIDIARIMGFNYDSYGGGEGRTGASFTGSGWV